jgi:serine/threonine protein kinase
MEIVQGGELFDRIIQKQMYNEKDARDLITILITTLKHCHDQNIVHRDVKAENLLMVSDKDDADVKLVDFGFAAKVDGMSLEGIMGTPEYMGVFIYVFIYTFVCINPIYRFQADTCMYIYTCIYTYTYVRIYLYMYVCVYIHVCI